VIGDAPVVTWERTEQNSLMYGQGFARPNVEVFLPVFPTACLHVLPAVPRTRPVRTPTTEEVNMAQAAFATQHCFTNVRSMEIDTLLQPQFGTVRLGIDGFSIGHLDYTKKLFEILMNRPPYRGRIDEAENSASGRVLSRSAHQRRRSSSRLRAICEPEGGIVLGSADEVRGGARCRTDG